MLQMSLFTPGHVMCCVLMFCVIPVVLPECQQCLPWPHVSVTLYKETICHFVPRAPLES